MREKENAMTTLKAFVRSTISVLAALLLIALAAGIGFFGPITRAAFGETTAQSVSLVEIGNSFTTEDGGKSMPIFAVMIGNTEKAERASLYWTRFFGLYATNGTFWVHPVDEPANIWKRIIYHRPRNIYEAQIFFADQEAWSFKETDKGHIILPSYARALTPAQLEKVDFIITYFDGGGTKVYVKSWTSPEDAKALFEAIERAHNK
ncbi:MAG: hypothetical protein A3G64_02855 [Candidatus Liptonbacteria bacterium RIFCSPLOWO2_12_FULL_60_15]|uniref:Uncharacterized protein n=1 Tax=Candidatus Liptonbacteria bacterium RIFCSPLOWO2_12_FULL_60_15 TaxID=1798653 RepID=A0A1G2CNC1_9BACT|nr:MAG: hypothetical protein A3G64_02855 [Candidatus Liptonbacteria bacterium RIFCSPLOWO2_12_FULL_60_15]